MSGDWYGSHFIDEEHLCSCVGDICGEGVPVALGKVLIKASTTHDKSTENIITNSNEKLSLENTRAMFAMMSSYILMNITVQIWSK